MNTVQRIAKNTALLVIAEIVTAIIGFFFIMYVARYLGAAGFGVLSFAIAFTAIFGVFTDVGLSMLITREVARDKSLTSQYLGNVAVMKVTLSIVVFAAIALTINLLGYPPQTIKVVYLVGLSVVGNAFSLMFQSVFQGHERMEFVAIGRILEAVLRLGGALIVIGFGLNIVTLALFLFIASIGGLAYNAVVSIWKFARPKLEIDWPFWEKTLSQGWPFALTASFVVIYHWTDSVMLSLMKGNEAVGWYNAASRLVMALLFIPGTYFSSVFPVMSRLFVIAPESLRLASEKSIKYMLIIAIPMAGGTTILADKIILQMFGPGYSNSVIILQILIWSAALFFVSAGFGRLLNSTNRQIIVAKVTGLSVLVNIILNLILIPKYGYVGAGAATVVTELATLTTLLVWSVRIGYGIPLGALMNISSKVLLASAITGVFVFFLGGVLALWWLIPLAVLLYFAVLCIIRGIDGEDSRLFRLVCERRSSLTVFDR